MLRCAAVNSCGRRGNCMMRSRIFRLYIRGTGISTTVSTRTRRNRKPPGSSFYIRLVIGILCFICFVYMDQSKVSVAEVDSTAIVNQIEKDMDAETIKEVWKQL